MGAVRFQLRLAPTRRRPNSIAAVGRSVGRRLATPEDEEPASELASQRDSVKHFKLSSNYHQREAIALHTQFSFGRGSSVAAAGGGSCGGSSGGGAKGNRAEK